MSYGLSRRSLAWGLSLWLIFWAPKAYGAWPNEAPPQQISREREIIERLVRLEEGQKAIVREMNVRFEAVDQRFQALEKRLEARFEAIDERFKAIDERFEAVDKRFESIEKHFELLEKRLDQLGNIFIGIVAAFAAIVAVTIGFAVWDRRTALRPYIDRHRELAEREAKVEKVLQGYAERHPDLAEILRREGLL